MEQKMYKQLLGLVVSTVIQNVFLRNAFVKKTKNQNNHHKSNNGNNFQLS